MVKRIKDLTNKEVKEICEQNKVCFTCPLCIKELISEKACVCIDIRMKKYVHYEVKNEE